MSIAKGAAIATLMDGKHIILAIGNHATYHLGQDAGSVLIMDPRVIDAQKPTVSMRYLRRRGKTPQGAFIDPDNNAEAYSVIE